MAHSSHRYAWIILFSVITTLCACGYPQLKELSDATDGGGTEIETPGDDLFCYGTGIVRVCLASPPEQSLLVASPTTIDTAQGFSCTPAMGGEGYCVVVATDIVIAQTLRATGPRPLILVASGSITVGAGGVIDVGSHRGVMPETGAGADPADCGNGVLPVAQPASGSGGGGAGGSFTTGGGSGGDGGANGSNSTGGFAAAEAPAASIARVQGGCPGQSGAGAPLGPSDTSAKGHGGGAVFLIATSMIDVKGAISAVGEGGGGGPPTQFGGCGGGGGGAGGMIGLDAPMVRSTGLLLASGGGGGGAGGSENTYYGAEGASATTTEAAKGGRGARSGIVGGNGGDGASTTTAAAKGLPGNNDSVSIGGGGGGGGGAGLVKAPSRADLGINVSPAPTP